MSTAKMMMLVALLLQTQVEATPSFMEAMEGHGRELHRGLVQCDRNPGCVDEGYTEGKCCPSRRGCYLSCCSEVATAELELPGTCSTNSRCANLGYEGPCCPNAFGVWLSCCDAYPTLPPTYAPSPYPTPRPTSWPTGYPVPAPTPWPTSSEPFDTFPPTYKPTDYPTEYPTYRPTPFPTFPPPPDTQICSNNPQCEELDLVGDWYVCVVVVCWFPV